MPEVTSGAIFSTCREYRYSLWRLWDSSKPTVTFCGLNPSTADETVDDPTIRRCIGYARDWGFGQLIMVNAYAYRSTDPKGLWATMNPIGYRNIDSIVHASRVSGLFVAAWGSHIKPLHSREIRRRIKQIHALRLTKSCEPSHPLYLPRSLRPCRLMSPASGLVSPYLGEEWKGMP